ncbi:hypothetical protein [Chitinimonas lacunae]|uniref:Uncharacterized protein n=1 Tax=Chitinimonas lacunae TaxID=1963018 RepID=A0ABV8MW56_9NEIS
MADRNEAKALLARAGVEINNALKRVDRMSESELQEVIDMAPVAFFDKNGSCGAPGVGDLKAFFDKNGSCGAGGLEAALNNVLKSRRN